MKYEKEVVGLKTESLEPAVQVESMHGIAVDKTSEISLMNLPAVSLRQLYGQRHASTASSANERYIPCSTEEISRANEHRIQHSVERVLSSSRVQIDHDEIHSDNDSYGAIVHLKDDNQAVVNCLKSESHLSLRVRAKSNDDHKQDDIDSLCLAWSTTVKSTEVAGKLISDERSEIEAERANLRALVDELREIERHQLDKGCQQHHLGEIHHMMGEIHRMQQQHSVEIEDCKRQYV